MTLYATIEALLLQVLWPDILDTESKHILITVQFVSIVVAPNVNSSTYRQRQEYSYNLTETIGGLDPIFDELCIKRVTE